MKKNKKTKITLEDLEQRIQALELIIRMLPIKQENDFGTVSIGVYCKWCGGVTRNCPGHSIC